MNPSDWIKATTLVTQHKQEAAIAEMDQLSSMPLSQIAMDDSGPPVVHYGITRKTTSVHSEQLHTMLTCADEVIMLTEKVGCTLVASYLKQFLEDYPPPSDKQAYLNIYHMLSLLDKYLHDNLKQHNHCMSSDNEYVILLKYAICLNIDLTAFPTLWAVLSILLDTQDGKCEYVKCVQEGYNTQYEGKSRQYMLKLEEKSIEIQNRIHDSVT